MLQVYFKYLFFSIPGANIFRKRLFGVPLTLHCFATLARPCNPAQALSSVVCSVYIFSAYQPHSAAALQFSIGYKLSFSKT
ncbi:MAG: hypothetical protein ACTTI5_08765, partial [Treponema sp.]